MHSHFLYFEIKTNSEFLLLLDKNCLEPVRIVLDKPKIGFQFGPGTKTYFRYVLNFTFWTLSKFKIYLGPVQNRFGPIETMQCTACAVPQRFYKPHYDYQNFSSLANGVYFIAVTNALSFYRSQNVLRRYKMFWASTNCLCRTKNWYAFSAPSKMFVPAQTKLSGTKSLGTAQFVHQFLVWHKRFVLVPINLRQSKTSLGTFYKVSNPRSIKNLNLGVFQLCACKQ